MSPQRQVGLDGFREAARRAVRRLGWNPCDDLEILEAGFAAASPAPSYGDRAGRVRLTYSSDLAPRLARLGGGAGTAAADDATGLLEAVVATRVYMSAGGYQICPYSAYDYAAILDAAADGLRSAGASEPEVLDFARPVASFFIASVITTVRALVGPDPPTFRRGWLLDQIVSVPEDGFLTTYSAVYVSAQLRLWSEDPEAAESLRSRFPRPFDALEFETDRAVAILLDTFELAGCVEDGLAWRDERLRELIIDELKYEWRRWPIKAFQYAELITPYVIEVPESRPNAAPPPGSPGHGEGSPSSTAEQRRAAIGAGPAPTREALLEEDSGRARVIPGAPTDPFTERFAVDPKFRRRVLAGGIGNGVNPLRYQMGFEALDALYRHRATTVELESETIHRVGMALDVGHLAREKLEHGVPSLNRIDWGATRVGPGGGLELYLKTLPLSDQTPVASRLRGVPDLLFVVDSSGSMAWDPRTGAGPYDSLLRAIYSVLAFLEQHDKAQHMRFAALNFSGTTLRTPWKSHAELRAVKELLFRHQNGGTVFETAPLEDLAGSSCDRFLCLMVTDGQIRNPDAVVQTVSRMLARGHRFVLIQIGASTPLVERLREMRVPAHTIADHAGLDGLYLDYTHEVWGGGTTP